MIRGHFFTLNFKVIFFFLQTGSTSYLSGPSGEPAKKSWIISSMRQFSTENTHETPLCRYVNHDQTNAQKKTEPTPRNPQLLRHLEIHDRNMIIINRRKRNSRSQQLIHRLCYSIHVQTRPLRNDMNMHSIVIRNAPNSLKHHPRSL